jgi:hypothetical protein
MPNPFPACKVSLTFHIASVQYQELARHLRHMQLIFHGKLLHFFFSFPKVVLTGEDIIFTIGQTDSNDGSGSGAEEGIQVISAKSIVTDIADVSRVCVIPLIFPEELSLCQPCSYLFTTSQ